MKKLLLVIVILILGLSSSYLWDKYPLAWVGMICVGFLILITRKREVWIKGTAKPMSILERQTRNTKAPASFVEAIKEKTILNAEAKTRDSAPYRMREIAKRLIFLDGYFAAWHQNISMEE